MNIYRIVNCSHGTEHIIESPYGYVPGEIIYPFDTRELYPGYNENRAKVVEFCGKTNTVIKSRKGFEKYYRG